MSIFIANAECRSCGGTGLYSGLGERDGSAVVCNTCKGSGCEKIKVEYTEFKQRKKKSGVIRVFETNPGICIGSGNGHKLEDFGGMPHDEWEAGKKFTRGMENRRYTCPTWWYQSADYKRKPQWKECLGCGAFSDCENFKSKDKCWERFDKEGK